MFFDSTNSNSCMTKKSNPRYPLQGDPIRALTTPVSFGRFMTQPLNWEKWFSFSHNRILEDVKKYSRPGAVAEKKPRPTTVPSPFSFKCDERAAKRKEFFEKLEERCKVNEKQTIQLQPKLEVFTKPRPTIVPSPFSFKCDERAAKRKEFFQKLEQRCKVYEMQTVQLQPKLEVFMKPRPKTVPSPFTFKCDERAAKRKEFFQKLEQRCKVNETQTIQLQPKLKDKTRSEKNRLRCSTALEVQASTSEIKAQRNNVQKGDPLRSLTTSVSFGRFMTEPLNWEKWSSFSHNRILEDAKKYCRPGAVAEKKAFFEAHYKNFAAEKPASSPQNENQVPNYSTAQPNTTANISPIAISKAYSSIDDTRENGPVTLVDVPHIDESMPGSTEVESEIALNEDVGSSSSNLDFSEISNDDNILSTSQVEEETLVENKRIHIKDAADMDKLSRLTKPEISSLKSASRYEEYKKLESPPKELAPGNLPKKTATDVMERKRSALQSLHLSMNFSPSRNNNGTSKTLSEHKATKVSENEVKKSSQVLPRPENKRSKPVIDCSTNGSRKVVLNSLSTNHSVAPNACTKKPKPTTVPSTFSFKCDERAAKRKEKLEQRYKVNQTQIIQLQPKLKGKTRSENNRLRCSTALEAKASTIETKAQSNNAQKGPPKLEGSQLGILVFDLHGNHHPSRKFL